MLTVVVVVTEVTGFRTLIVSVWLRLSPACGGIAALCALLNNYTLSRLLALLILSPKPTLGGAISNICSPPVGMQAPSTAEDGVGVAPDVTVIPSGTRTAATYWSTTNDKGDDMLTVKASHKVLRILRL